MSRTAPPARPEPRRGTRITRITRTTRISATAAAAVIAVALAACSGAGTASPAASGSADTATAVEGGTLRYAVNYDIGCLDPSLSTGNSILTGNIVDSLVYQNDDNTFSPWLATEWTISDDGLDYTFTLRDDVTFSDGTPLDAEAVAYNIDRIANPETGSAYAKSLIGTYTGSTVVDEHTVTLSLAKPLTSFLQGLSLAYLGIQSPTALKAEGKESCSAVVGSGPFVLSDYTAGQSWTLEKRDDYHWPFEPAGRTGAAYLDRVEIVKALEASVRVNGVQSDTFDLIYGVPYASYEALRSAQGVTLDDFQPGGIANAVAINAQSGIFSDKLVRNAFQSAIDVKTLVSSTFFNAVDASLDGPFTENSQYFDASVGDLYGYDPKKAVADLEKAGWTQVGSDGIRVKDGQKLTVTLYSFPAPSQDVLNLVQALQQAALAVGFDISYEQLDQPAWNQVIADGSYDLQLHSYFRSEPDIARTVYSEDYVPPLGYTFARPGDPELEALLDEASETPDGDARGELYAQIQERVIEQGYSLPLYPISRAFAYRDTVHSFSLNGTAAPFLYNVWLDAE